MQCEFIAFCRVSSEPQTEANANDGPETNLCGRRKASPGTWSAHARTFDTQRGARALDRRCNRKKCLTGARAALEHRPRGAHIFVWCRRRHSMADGHGRGVRPRNSCPLGTSLVAMPARPSRTAAQPALNSRGRLVARHQQETDALREASARALAVASGAGAALRQDSAAHSRPERRRLSTSLLPGAAPMHHRNRRPRDPPGVAAERSRMAFPGGARPPLLVRRQLRSVPERQATVFLCVGRGVKARCPQIPIRCVSRYQVWHSDWPHRGAGWGHRA